MPTSIFANVNYWYRGWLITIEIDSDNMVKSVIVSSTKFKKKAYLASIEQAPKYAARRAAEEYVDEQLAMLN